MLHHLLTNACLDRWYSRGGERSNEKVIDRVRHWRWSTVTWHSTVRGLSAHITWPNSAAPSISVILPSASARCTAPQHWLHCPANLTRVQPVLCACVRACVRVCGDHSCMQYLAGDCEALHCGRVCRFCMFPIRSTCPVRAALPPSVPAARSLQPPQKLTWRKWPRYVTFPSSHRTASSFNLCSGVTLTQSHTPRACHEFTLKDLWLFSRS